MVNPKKDQPVDKSCDSNSVQNSKSNQPTKPVMQTLFKIHDQPIDKSYKEFKIAIDACGKFNIAETQNKSHQKSSKFSTSEQGAQEVRTEFVFVKVPQLGQIFWGNWARETACARSVYSQIVI